jgi:hypothetical protein
MRRISWWPWLMPLLSVANRLSHTYLHTAYKHRTRTCSCAVTVQVLTLSSQDKSPERRARSPLTLHAHAQLSVFNIRKRALLALSPAGPP